MAAEPPDKRTRIIEATLARVSRYGFRRTSMEDIANEAGISRPALYLEFRNKEEIFRTAAEQLQNASLERAREAAAGNEPLAERLRAVVEAKSLGFVEIAFQSPHGSEILDETNRLCGDIVGEAQQRFRKLLTDIFQQAAVRGEIDPGAVGLKPAAAADLLMKALHGLKSPGVTVAEFRTSLAALIRLFVAGMDAKIAPVATEAQPRRARRR